MAPAAAATQSLAIGRERDVAADLAVFSGLFGVRLTVGGKRPNLARVNGTPFA
jgi:hypothetical protein